MGGSPNASSVAKSALLGATRLIAPRLFPWLNVLSLGFDLYNMYRVRRPDEYVGFHVEENCRAADDGPTTLPYPDCAGARTAGTSPPSVVFPVTEAVISFSTSAFFDVIFGNDYYKRAVYYVSDADPNVGPYPLKNKAWAYPPNWFDDPQKHPGKEAKPTPGVNPAPLPDLTPIDPFSAPIGVPMSTPRPVPYWAIPGLRPNPMRSPVERTHRGPARAPVRAPVRAPGPITVPVEIPTIVIEPVPVGVPGPGGSPAPAPVSRSNAARPVGPPPARTKETKALVAPVWWPVVKWALNGITEGLDAFYAIYDALPLRYKARGARRFEQHAAALYRNFEHVDWNKALENMIRNEVEDAILGRVGRSLAKGARSNPYYNRPVGFQAGPGL